MFQLEYMTMFSYRNRPFSNRRCQKSNLRNNQLDFLVLQRPRNIHIGGKVFAVAEMQQTVFVSSTSNTSSNNKSWLKRHMVYDGILKRIFCKYLSWFNLMYNFYRVPFSSSPVGFPRKKLPEINTIGTRFLH